ncbi:hypothetical protein M1O18_03965 [Dehalococcoidia bacterium]|nr:hypothetical protein [Dehalococcoidia bacterium]
MRISQQTLLSCGGHHLSTGGHHRSSGAIGAGRSPSRWLSSSGMILGVAINPNPGGQSHIITQWSIDVSVSRYT